MLKREKVIKMDDFVTYQSVYDFQDDRVEDIQKNLWPKLVKAST